MHERAIVIVQLVKRTGFRYMGTTLLRSDVAAKVET